MLQCFLPEVFGVGQIDQYLPFVAIGAKCPDHASSRTSFASSRTQSAAIDEPPLLAEDMQLAVGDPARLAQPRQLILLEYTGFAGEGQRALMMLPCAAVI
ncbi:MAG: hypothetical protein DI637_00455 [Citromicrobium sp.]|nr:hypothetical protein A3711_07055 [Erythrobacter sp. HI00D59]PZT92577.1 MAG: hypothetical protein DI637_00455 [Citromicrobium sp.]